MSGIKMIKMQNMIKTKCIRERWREKHPACQQVGWMCGLKEAGGSALLLSFAAPQLSWIWRPFCWD